MNRNEVMRAQGFINRAINGATIVEKTEKAYHFTKEVASNNNNALLFTGAPYDSRRAGSLSVILQSLLQYAKDWLNRSKYGGSLFENRCRQLGKYLQIFADCDLLTETTNFALVS